MCLLLPHGLLSSKVHQLKLNINLYEMAKYCSIYTSTRLGHKMICLVYTNNLFDLSKLLVVPSRVSVVINKILVERIKKTWQFQEGSSCLILTTINFRVHQHIETKQGTNKLEPNQLNELEIVFSCATTMQSPFTF